MLHNYLAFKLKNGFLLRLTTLLFPVRVKGGWDGEDRGERMGQGKGEAEEKYIKNERRVLDTKKCLDILIFPNTNQLVKQTS